MPGASWSQASTHCVAALVPLFVVSLLLFARAVLCPTLCHKLRCPVPDVVTHAVLSFLAITQVVRARAEFFRGKPAKWRMAEPCLLIIIFVTLGMILPLFFPCTPTQVPSEPESDLICMLGSSFSKT